MDLYQWNFGQSNAAAGTQKSDPPPDQEEDTGPKAGKGIKVDKIGDSSKQN